jgi:hypothetical protein
MGVHPIRKKPGSCVFRLALIVLCAAAGLCFLASPSFGQTGKDRGALAIPESQIQYGLQRTVPIQPAAIVDSPPPVASARPSTPPVGTPIAAESLPRADETQLLALEAEEKQLLVDFADEHPQVIAVRARIKVIREILARRPAAVRPVETDVPLPPLGNIPPLPSSSFVNQPGVTGPGTGRGWSVLPDIQSTKPAAPPALPAEPIQVISFTTPLGNSERKPLEVNPEVKTLTQPLPPTPTPAAADPGPLPPVCTGEKLKVIQQPTSPPAGEVRPAPAAPPEKERTASQAPQQVQLEHRPEGSSLPSLLVALIGFFAVLVVGLILHVTALCYIMRRFGKQLSSLMALQSALPTQPWPSAGAALATFSRDELPGSGQPGPTSDSTSAEAPPSVPPERRFDLGPTYEEEVRRLAEEAQSQEAAVLEEIFRDNVRLLAQIGTESEE